MTLKSGEARQFNTMCPFDCTTWDECVCENTAIRDGIDVTGFTDKWGRTPYHFTAREIGEIQERSRGQ